MEEHPHGYQTLRLVMVFEILAEEVEVQVEALILLMEKAEAV